MKFYLNHFSLAHVMMYATFDWMTVSSLC